MQSNAQLNNSIETGGRHKFLIASGQTEEGYAAILSQALVSDKAKSGANESIYQCSS